MAELEERKRQLNYKSRLEDEEELRNVSSSSPEDIKSLPLPWTITSSI